MATPDDKEKAIFHSARAIAEPSQRAIYLNAACEGDSALRQRIESLLVASDDAGAFLESPLLESQDRHAEAAVDELPGNSIGSYKLLEKIGEGGFGVVYMAEQAKPIRRRVALKIIKLGMDTKQIVARFEAERQALALMDHPNIAKVYDAGATDDGRPYFVMDLIPGVPVTEYCDNRRLCTAERLRLFAKICEAIQHAHQKGIIHRDIKPTNILVSTDGDRPVPKVIDFGIAKATHGRLTDRTLFTQFREFIGTPAYMSPEQAQMSAIDVDTRSDIYSLGVLMYELLTGQTPLDTKSLVNEGYEEICRCIREEEVLRPSKRVSSLQQEELTALGKLRRIAPSQFTSSIRGDLDWIVMKAVEKDRSRRYESCGAFVSDIDRYLRNEPVAAGPPNTWNHVRKFAQRNRTAVLMMVAIAGSLLIGTVAATLGWLRAVDAKEELANQVVVTKSALNEAQIARDMAAADRKRAVKTAYLADMQAAHQSLLLDNFGLAKQILNRNRIFEADNDPRHWEWRALWARCQPGYESAIDAARGVSTLAVHPNGKWLATRGGIWDVNHGKLVRRLVEKLDENIALGQPEFSPDGNELYVADQQEGAIRSWTLPECEATDLEFVHGAAFNDFAISSDGKTLVAISKERVSVWDIPSRNLRKSWGVPDGHRVAISNDSLTLAMGLADGINIYELQTLEHIRIVGGKAEKDWTARFGLAFSPDGKFITSAMGVTNPELRLHRVADGERVASLVGHTHSVFDAAFSPNGKLIAVASHDQTVSIWDAETHEQIAKLIGHEFRVNAVAFSVDGKRLYSGGQDAKICVWDIESLDRGRWPVAKAEACQWWGWCRPQVSYSPDGRVLATTRFQPADGSGLPGFTIRLAETLEVKETLAESGAVKTGVLYSPTANMIAVGDADGSLQFIDTDNPQEIRSIQLQQETNIYPMQFTPDGKRLVVGSRHERTATDDPMCFVLSAIDRVLISSWHLPRDYARTYPLTISPDGSLVASGHADGVRFWSTTDPSNPIHVPVGNPVIPEEGSLIWSLDFSPDGKYLAAGNDSGFIELVDVKTRDVVGQFVGHLIYVGGLRFSRDGTRLASVGSGKSEGLKLWDVESRRQILSLQTERQSYGNRHVEWSPDGKSIMTMGGDSRVRIWRVPSLEEIASRERQ